MANQEPQSRKNSEYAGRSSAEGHQQKQRALTHDTPSITRSISNALVMKNENLFFLSLPNGDVPLTRNHGYGLYYHDCRYLNGYILRMANSMPTVLVSTARSGFSSIIELSNPEIITPEGMHIHRDVVGLRWERVLDGSQNRLCDYLTLQNYSLQDVSLPLSLTFQAQFEDIFFVRGILREQPGQLHPPRWQDQSLICEYSGADGIFRSLKVHFSPPPELVEGSEAFFTVHLGRRESLDIMVTAYVHETPSLSDVATQPATWEHAKDISQEFHQNTALWQAGLAVIDGKERILRDVLGRALTDLRTLRSDFGGEKYYAAGVPWFATLFGRDSIISSLQMLALSPEIAASTLQLLARYQAHKTNPWQDAQPGKILHELRDGELAHLGDIPHTPYYGSVDATPLFLLLVARTAAWTGKLDLFNQLRPNIEAALNWIDEYGDSDGDGFVDYQVHSRHGLVNQGWKDSGIAIVNADGSLVIPPVALAEVQGYVYRAWIGIADLYQWAGDPERANQLRARAAELRARFNRDFWSDRIGTYVLALQAGEKPAEVVASNAGQVLWTGIAEPEKAAATVRRLMADDMFNGWGIRTLSRQDNRYNPTGYHLGTVWPFDTALIAAGFRRYGHDCEAEKLSTAMFEAALQFEIHRLPELFAGFSRESYGVPVHYPVACHPQAWSASSVPYLLTSLLGLIPDGFNRRLAIVRPRLPELMGAIDIHGLAVGDASVDLSFYPTENETASVKVLHVNGKLDVEIVTDQGDFDF